jgi:hypothetical protein
MISFQTSKADFQVLNAIADRAVAMAVARGLAYEKQEALMDVTAAHCNGNPLRLEELAGADDFHFAHDVFGIRRHINRETGKLENCFVPRFARLQ